MHLYQKQNEKILVYELLPIFNKLFEYRKEKLPNAKILEAKTNSLSNNRLLENCSNYISYNELNCYKESKYHVLEVQIPQNEELIHGVWSGLYNQNKMVKIVNKEKTLKYLLLTTKYYEKVKEKDTIHMTNIIDINKEIYLLQSMLQDNILNLYREDFYEQLQLFCLEEKPIFAIDENKLIILSKMGFIENNFNQLEKKLEISNKIFKKVK